jgi:hypothetical protein
VPTTSEAARELARKRWDGVTDRTAATEAARQGRVLSIARQLDPDGALGLEERARQLFAGGGS